MKVFLKHSIHIISLSLLSLSLHAQYFATLKVNTHNVYMQQPIKATVTVYTSTWFTDSPDLGNVSIPNAFVLPFKRTVSGIQYINNKQYASLELFYLIFPFESGEIIIPEMHISIATPPEGDYKGVIRQLKTKPLSIRVKEAPAEFKGKEWLVSKNAYISDTWNSSLDDVKVGEVIERTVTIRALGTLPAFIPETSMEANNWSSIYPRQAQLKDTRTSQDANGLRIEKYRYLLEKEGEFEIEPLTVTWWNPYLNKQYERSSKARTITIKANPDLGMLTSMRDSLNTNTVENSEIEAEEPLLIMGLSLKQFILLTCFILICLWMMLITIRQIMKQIKLKREHYLGSEQYYFDQLVKTSSKSSKEQINSMYSWLLNKHKKQYSTKNISSDNLQELIADYYQSQNNKPLSKKEIKEIKKLLKDEASQADHFFPPLNP
ncbi:BatD family protein [Carboxylicivirga marina]|uniref:BatD family protein n=1 Tax=Carboxylicivirga marina TaxID=2800988 RepID=A0ABS1HFL1_9BACT|nr:BatD family protein [Carboxylicivirga marina]MBK3516432.1 BatD family protein [Carboxylicivirga marina]